MNKMAAFASNTVEVNERRLVVLTGRRREDILTMKVVLVGITLVAGVCFALWVQPEAKNDD